MSDLSGLLTQPAPSSPAREKGRRYRINTPQPWSDTAAFRIEWIHHRAEFAGADQAHPHRTATIRTFGKQGMKADVS
ncbi:hypothetical protein RFM98_06545 [Mesorhizobium sp. VK9D]|uniref:hypothetical protein n=1 Tax=Mesorhizobium australafricanum TaxID=3072311 RepID=UPI002A243F8A|nr:hypothetical protein [Mesorhizobium sp. VK9D]MDX8452408.1 hypothetical protein [Mesorhizobium sp. VK9D]